MQTLSDSLDEVKARLNNLEKAMKSVQDQQQSIDAALQNLTQPAASPAAAGTATPPQTPPHPRRHPARKGKRSPEFQPARRTPQTPHPPFRQSWPRPPLPPSTRPLSATTWPPTTRWPPPSSPRSSAPAPPTPGRQLLLLSGRDRLPRRQVLHRHQGLQPRPRAVPQQSQVPVSHLHKGQALFETGKREAGITELRALISRFPNSPKPPRPAASSTEWASPSPPPPRPITPPPSLRIILVCHSRRESVFCLSFWPHPERSPFEAVILSTANGVPASLLAGAGRISVFRRCLFLHFSGSILREMRLSYRC